MRLIDADALKVELAKNITIWTFNVSYDGILAEIIDNAPTVERPQGDLISRSALKKAIQDHFDNLDGYFPNAFIKEIDNAPTVELKRVKNELNNELNELRPQGKWKWIVKSTNIQLEPDCIMCSNCKFMFNNATPYCPNCGSYMGGDNNG